MTDEQKNTCESKESCCCSGKKCNCARNLVIVVVILGVAGLIWWLTKK